MSSYAAILTLFVAYSIGIGTWFVNLAPVLADHHGIDKIASSYGLVRMFHGLSTLAMPPLFGESRPSTCPPASCHVLTCLYAS